MSRKQEDGHPVTQDAVAGVANPTGVILNDGTGKTGETLKELKEEGLAGAPARGCADRHCLRLEWIEVQINSSGHCACGVCNFGPGCLTSFSPPLQIPISAASLQSDSLF